MTGLRFRFAGADLVALGSGALFWPAQDLLIVADLHLGKSERMARRGGALLPPYETRETLRRLDAAIAATGAGRVLSLGDSFDDDAAQAALGDDDAGRLAALAGSGRAWQSISGNHDPAQGDAEIRIDGIALRHEADAGLGGPPDISGHFHPKARLGRISRPAFLIGDRHLILPAFGAYTGGLYADAPVLRALVPRGIAVLTGPRPVALPLG